MGFQKCSRDDLLTQRIRQVYSANVVRAPNTGVKLFDVYLVKGKHVEKRGSLEPLLLGDDPLKLPPPTESLVVDLSGSRSTEVDVELGLDLTAKFLSALGVPVPGATVDASLWSGASSYSFEVRDVRQRQVDVNRLGAAVLGRRLDPDQPAGSIFFTDPDSEMHIVTRILISPQVAVRAKGKNGQSIEASVDAIKDLIGKAGAKIKWKSETDGAVSFTGSEAVTFALAAVQCTRSTNGALRLGFEVEDTKYFGAPDSVPEPMYLAVHCPFVDDDGLLELG